MDEWNEWNGLNWDINKRISNWGIEKGIKIGDKKLWISITQQLIIQ